MGVWSMKEAAKGHAGNEAGKACRRHWRRRQGAAVSEPNATSSGEAGGRGAAAIGERDDTIAATEQCAGAALQIMITDESLTVFEAVQWCAGAISHREATRLANQTDQRPLAKPPSIVAAGL
jgi:hypothetical protein